MRMNAMDQNILDVKTFLIYCAQAHPKAQVQDYVKRIRQSEFGTDLDLSDPEESLKLLREEIGRMTDKMLRRPWFDPFFGPFCRMNMSVSQVISPELIYRIQQVSNQHVPKSAWIRFEEKLRIFAEMC